MPVFQLAPLRPQASLRRTTSLDRSDKLLRAPYGTSRRRAASNGGVAESGTGKVDGLGPDVLLVVRHNSAPEGFHGLQGNLDQNFAAEVEAACLEAMRRKKSAQALEERVQGAERDQQRGPRVTESAAETAVVTDSARKETVAVSEAVGCDGDMGWDRDGEEPIVWKDERRARESRAEAAALETEENEADFDVRASKGNSAVLQDGNEADTGGGGGSPVPRRYNLGVALWIEGDWREEAGNRTANKVPSSASTESAAEESPRREWSTQRNGAGQECEGKGEAEVKVQSCDATCPIQPSGDQGYRQLAPLSPLGKQTGPSENSVGVSAWQGDSENGFESASEAGPYTSKAAKWKGWTKKANSKGPLPDPTNDDEACDVVPGSAQVAPDGGPRFLRSTSRRLREASERRLADEDQSGCFPFSQTTSSLIRLTRSKSARAQPSQANWPDNGPVNLPVKGSVVACEERRVEIKPPKGPTGAGEDSGRGLWSRVRGQLRRMGNTKVCQVDGMAGTRM